LTVGTNRAGRGDEPPRFRINRAYVAALEAAGATPVLLPLVSDQGTLRQLFGLLAGLVLPGGADVAPARYGQEPLPCLGEVDPDLDRVELELARWAVEADLPLLGICRGLQVLNVALGGTLYQDIATQRAGALAHRGAGRPRNELHHPVRLERGSRLAELLGATEFAVNSLHHQAIDQLAGAARAVGWAPDGVIEAIELPDRRFAVAVQFHPEELWPEHEPSRRLFAAFVAACAAE
jgi:putative glutamine amidotransferase